MHHYNCLSCCMWPTDLIPPSIVNFIPTSIGPLLATGEQPAAVSGYTRTLWPTCYRLQLASYCPCPCSQFLLPSKVLETKTLTEAVDESIANLDTFWLVGVIEQYDGFMAVLRRMLDPDDA